MIMQLKKTTSYYYLITVNEMDDREKRDWCITKQYLAYHHFV